MASDSRSRLAGLLALLMAGSFAAPAGAKVFYSRQEALELAFPGATRVEDQTFVLREDQVAMIESIAKSDLETRLVKLHTGYRDDELLGYAFIDIHNVRSLPEAFMVVLSPEGSVRSLRVLAFHEPLDYMPPQRWYAQFDEASREQPLRVGRDIHGIVGATLSARATTNGVRRALAIYEVLVENGH